MYNATIFIDEMIDLAQARDLRVALRPMKWISPSAKKGPAQGQAVLINKR